MSIPPTRAAANSELLSVASQRLPGIAWMGAPNGCIGKLPGADIHLGLAVEWFGGQPQCLRWRIGAQGGGFVTSWDPTALVVSLEQHLRALRDDLNTALAREPITA